MGDLVSVATYSYEQAIRAARNASVTLGPLTVVCEDTQRWTTVDGERTPLSKHEMEISLCFMR